MTSLLVSIANLDELPVALEGGADLIDAKNPQKGALGAWSNRQIALLDARLDVNLRQQGLLSEQGREQEAVPKYVPKEQPKREQPKRGQPKRGLKKRWSIAAGDPPADPSALRQVLAVLAQPVRADFVKIGLHRPDDPKKWKGMFDALAEWHGRRRLIPVLFADQFQDGDDPSEVIRHAIRIGVAGIMVDTADKTVGSLGDYWDMARIADFCTQARDGGLICGLAGSLRIEDIPPLVKASRPDYLGFRGALCGPSGRASALQLSLVQHAATLLMKSRLPQAKKQTQAKQ